MFIAAIVLFVVSALWILLKVKVAYNSYGGRDMEPIYDAATYPPILITIGVFLAVYSYESSLPFWAYLLIWLGTIGVVVGILKLFQILGDKPL